jgi:transcriptional regulator with XRE-family HTH domain
VSRPERKLSPDRSALDRFGYELRERRKARGLSQARLGALVHVSGDLVHRIELGQRRPGRDFAERCDRALEAGGALIELWDKIEEEARQLREAQRDIDKPAVGMDKLPDQAMAMLGPEIIVVQMMSLNGESVPVAVDRRALMAGAVSLPIVGWLGRDPKRVLQLPETVPAGDLRDILRDMISLRVVLTRQDNILGSAVVAPTVIHQLSILKRLGGNSKGEARESVMRLQAAYAEFAGWLSDELGDWNAGQYWIDRALEWAHETDDELIVGYILARKSQRAGDTGDPAAAVSLARAAQRRNALTERVRAAALQYEALGHASMGETAEFCTSIDRARELTESAQPASDNEWAVWCTPEYVTMHEASGWVRLGEPARAVAAYERGLANWPHAFLRDQGVYYGRLARAHAAARNPEEAADAGRKALDISARTGSARILRELKPLPASLDSWRHLALVKEFSADLRQALATQEEPQRLTSSD